MENNTGTMMIQLMFNNKPQSPTTEQFRNALEKRFGDLGDWPYPQTAKENNGDTFMFPLAKHKVFLQDKPDGIPVMAAYLSSEPGLGIDLDEMKRSQLWDVPNADKIIDECKYTILVNTMLGAVLPYKEQAEIMLSQLEAALECYPGCIGIYAPQSGKLITPEMFEKQKVLSLADRFIQIFVNIRFFNISDTNEMVIDTLGFFVFGGDDVQVHFKELNPKHVANFVYSIASYQFDNDYPIKNGDTVDSINENGKLQITPQWTVQYENALIAPERSVLDINCGKYAGGNR